MIIVDSSALIEVLIRGPQAERVAAALERRDRFEMSCANYVEAGMVLALKDKDHIAENRAVMEAAIRRSHISLVTLDPEQAREALSARIRFGKGFGHRAGLNYGDSFAYALAKVRNAPLLYIGDDFAQTDIKPALARP